MGNIMDYLDWRGDVKLEHSPFNEVDNLILSQFVYVNWDYIVPGKWSDSSITVHEAVERYTSLYDEDQIQQFTYMIRSSIPLIYKMAKSPRFANAKLSKFEKVIDIDRTKQFTAMQIELDDGSIYVAYRGTDNTIVGWKENFNMTVSMPVASQYEALWYLEDTIVEGDAPLRLGGHSKGGNLAVYAAIMCRPEIQDRIVEVYNNDGPGFEAKIIKSEAYQRILGRIRLIVPQSSVVGMLLEHEEEYIVVQSNVSLLMQHEAFSWEVLGNSFVRGESLEKKSELLEMTLKSWLGQMNKSERQRFVAALFHVFEAGDIRTFDDLGRAKWQKINEMIRILNQSPEYKDVLIKTLKLLLKEGRKVIMSARKKKSQGNDQDVQLLE